MDLREACWGRRRWTVRRLLTHIAGLPPESAYRRELRGDRADWSQDTEILASIVDALGTLSHYYLAVNSEDSPDQPARFPRPGELERAYEPPTVSLADFARSFEE